MSLPKSKKSVTVIGKDLVLWFDPMSLNFTIDFSCIFLCENLINSDMVNSEVCNKLAIIIPVKKGKLLLFFPEFLFHSVQDGFTVFERTSIVEINHFYKSIISI